MTDENVITIILPEPKLGMKFEIKCDKGTRFVIQQNPTRIIPLTETISNEYT